MCRCRNERVIDWNSTMKSDSFYDGLTQSRTGIDGLKLVSESIKMFFSSEQWLDRQYTHNSALAFHGHHNVTDIPTFLRLVCIAFSGGRYVANRVLIDWEKPFEVNNPNPIKYPGDNITFKQRNITQFIDNIIFKIRRDQGMNVLSQSFWLRSSSLHPAKHWLSQD